MKMILRLLGFGRQEVKSDDSLPPTPAHDSHNPDLLALVPGHVRAVLEVGCGSGALAREVKLRNPGCHYLGVDISAEYTALAKRYCDATLTMNIDQATEAFFARQRDRDCWVFGDCLEHLKDPWRILEAIRMVIPQQGYVVACIPNSQHWSLQARLALGEWRYEDAGLLDRTHLRFFTRKTIIDLFESTGFHVEQMGARVFDEPGRDGAVAAIAEVAAHAGGDREVAKTDATPLQYVLRAVPA